MAKKYYAVKQGKKTGIFTTWDECKQNVHGYPGAEYKSFTNKAEAENYLHGAQEDDGVVKGQADEVDSEVVAYVDGSFNEESNEFSYGAVIFYEGEQLQFNEKFNDPELVSMRNVAGEIKGSEKAMAFAIEQGAKTLSIHYDYEGIAKWCTGEWKATKPGTLGYKKYYDGIKKDLQIRFVKVKSHSGDEFNDLADKLAKEAFVQTENVDTSNKDTILEKSKKLGIYTDSAGLADLIKAAGVELWDSFHFISLEEKGNVTQCIFAVDGKPCTLNFHSKNNGTTTMSPTGKNTEFSNQLKEKIFELSDFKDTGEAKSHTFTITKDWAGKLVCFLEQLEGVTKELKEHEASKLEQYKFISSIGDRLNVNVYATGKVVLQGKPAYLYTEALSFLSYSPQVTVKDVVEANNKFHEVDVNVSETREELKKLMPNTYGVLDDTLFKILSPAISLRKFSSEIEDYSCYAFPALRALEGYLKQLFEMEEILIGHSFASQFGHDTKTNAFHLKENVIQDLKNPKMEAPLVEVYSYLNKNRHTLFHTERMLITTRILEDQVEADLIVNEVIEMIERTYTYITA
ncbi:viroplasmin family protein [Sporosarcina sp. 179-K 8C2 HS]|uniref:ribonuclease H1 domain-containing protein n=1 Tax=Sporosarcina sp. 179-K 8C2 HS TaxID=3142387 RepID=UPI00399FFA9D